MMKPMTILEATQYWIYGFNAIPTTMIARLMTNNPEEWEEETMPTIGDSAYVYDENTDGEITAEVEDGYVIQLNGDKTVTQDTGDFELIHTDILHMWGTMWTFGDTLDEDWLESGEGLKALSDCGFRVFHHDDFGYFFGIDGAGYDFYEAHWVPLYTARGLHWHIDA